MSVAASSPQISRRSLIFVLIVLLHVGFFYALNSGLSHSVIDVVFGPIETRIIEEQKVEAKEPPPPPPNVKVPPPDYVPPPDLSIELPVTDNTSAIQNVTSQKPVERPAPPPPAVAKTLPKSDPKRPLTQPDYPPTSRRLGEAGTVVLDVYVLENGRVGDARVKKSSGYERLDQAAVNEVKRSWRLVPGTEEGKPAPMWGQFAVTFKLTD